MSLIKQQSKAEWVGYGDECSRLFMAKIKQRKAMTCIYQLKNKQGQWVQGFDKVTDIMTDYYTELLGKKGTQRNHIDPHVTQYGNTLSLEQQITLCQPFKDTEIKQAIFSIPDFKSPGPDGFSSGFYKASWENTSTWVCQAVHEFFRNGELPSFFGETKLVMLPKITNPEYATDFRPISCCNVIYKTITKLLCSRLKEVLPHLINESQGAFVQGRELLFNVLLCQDLTRGYNRKYQPPSCIMKIDIQKAFDSVHWDFLQEWLRELKFPPLFIRWVMKCITSVQFTISINGKQGKKFRGMRGLKQGDPLSPLLFVLSMEYLSRLFKKASLQPEFEFHPHCKKLGITHLMFADDLVIICKASPISVSILMRAFQQFTACSGLQINMSKSQIVFGGASASIREECKALTGFTEGNLPFSYLGLPITASKLSKVECRTLVEKITARIRTWASRHISYAGRLVLVNSVLFGIFNFWAQVFMLPRAVIDQVTRLCRNFL